MADLKKELFSIEKRLWDNDADFYEKSLTDQARLAFPETGHIDRNTAVQAIRVENNENRKWSEVVFSQEQLVRLSADASLITYRVKSKWNYADAYVFAIASSIYVLHEGQWKLIFHQQTPMEKET